MNVAHTITIYGRPGCHLCEEALTELAEIAAGTGAEVVEINIEDDDALHRAHLERIPVILVNGAEVCTFFVDREAILGALS